MEKNVEEQKAPGANHQPKKESWTREKVEKHCRADIAAAIGFLHVIETDEPLFQSLVQVVFDRLQAEVEKDQPEIQFPEGGK